MQLGDPLRLNSYFSNFLFYRSWAPRVWNYHEAWMRMWKMLQNGELFGPSVPTNDPNLIIRIPIKNRQAVKAVVAGRTANADGTLTLTFTNPTYDAFRVSHNVTDTSMNEGYIVATAPGQITIKPLFNPTVYTAAEFILNTTVMAYGKLAGLRFSTGTTPIYETKDMQEDYVEITRESQPIARTDKANRFYATVDNVKYMYGYHEAEADMISRFMYYSVFKRFFGAGGNGVTGLEGQMNKTMGIRNRIINDSGNYISGAGPIDQTTFETILSNCADANPGFNQDILILPGRNALKQLQTFYPSELAFVAGQQLGNKTVGITLDIREINFAGIRAKVAMDFPMLNDTVNLPAWMKDSIFFLNRAQTMIDGQMRPLIQPVHFATDGSGEYRPYYRCVPGMIGPSPDDSTGLPFVGQYQLAGSSVDGYSCEAIDYSGVSMVGYGHGLYEYIHGS